jgi:hypothetical protein
VETLGPRVNEACRELVCFLVGPCWIGCTSTDRFDLDPSIAGAPENGPSARTVRFTKWHEKRIDSLVALYGAFSDYLDFLRRALYFDHEGRDLTRMHEFRRAIDAQMVFLDDRMAEKIDRYQSELLMFWNWAMTSLGQQGEVGREEVQRRLDFEIPAYLSLLRRDINAFLDPHYKEEWLDPRLLAANQSRSKTEVPQPKSPRSK